MSLLYPTLTLRQFGQLLLFGFSGTWIAGAYGLVHDLITFSLGPEYFTEFKFHQFHYLDKTQPEWLIVAEIGFLATWWVGFIAAWFMGRLSLPHLSVARSAILSLQGVGIMVLCALSAAMIAATLSPKTLEDPRMVHWQDLLMPHDVIDGVAFVRVAYIHNASYLGGLMGLLASFGWIIWQRRQVKTRVS